MVASAAMQQFMQTLQATNMELRLLANQAMAANPALEELPPEGENDFASSFPPEATSDSRHHDYLVNSITESPSLAAYLEEQIHQSALPDKAERAALQLIQHLDERGYFSEPPAEIARRNGWSYALFQEAMQAIQDLDPAGVGAVDLRESLMLQLRREGEEKSLAMLLLREHWDKLVLHRYAEAAKLLGESELAIAGAARRIAQLNPDPGNAFARTPDGEISADIVVRRENDELKVLLTSANIPQLTLSAEYREMMAEQADKPEVRHYLSRCFSEGRNLIKAIENRQRTILQVAQQIVQRQKDFFLHSNAALIPLRMEDIAEVTGLHISTISRAVNGKYLQCSRGIIELRRFFTAAINSGQNAADISQDTVLKRMRELIAAENSQHPLSDASLAELLKKEGISVARRTIAKYRDSLHILPANQRKR